MADIYNKRVAHYRKLAKLTQAQVAEKLGMKNSTYSQLERKGKIGVEQLVKIAKILDIDVSLLLYDEGFAVLGKDMPNETSKNGGNPKLQQETNFGFDDAPSLPITQKEENIIKVLRNMSKEDRDEVIDFIECKRMKNK